MSKQTVGIGASANDGTGDTLRDAFGKVNDNFAALFPVGPWAQVTDPTEGQVLTLPQPLVAGTILRLFQLRTTGGLACDVTVKIGSTAVTGLSAVGATGTAADTDATAANTYVRGDVITATFSSVTGTGSVLFTLEATR